LGVVHFSAEFIGKSREIGKTLVKLTRNFLRIRRNFKGEPALILPTLRDFLGEGSGGKRITCAKKKQAERK